MLNANTHSGVTTLEMNHGKVNAMDLEFCVALIEAINSFEQSAAKCLVIRSRTQKRVFSAGIDLKRISTEPISYTREYFPKLIQLFEQVYFCSKPTLAVVEGPAIAGGCVMAVACTQRIGTANAAFGMPNKKLDVPIPQLAPVILRNVVPRQIASQLHSETLFSSRAALDCGVLSRVVSDKQLDAAILEQTKELISQQFEPQLLDPELITGFQSEDQRMIEDWCGDGLRSKIAKYMGSLSDTQK